jgi:hypothetical protein
VEIDLNTHDVIGADDYSQRTLDFAHLYDALDINTSVAFITMPDDWIERMERLGLIELVDPFSWRLVGTDVSVYSIEDLNNAGEG